MSIERARRQLEKHGLADRIIEFTVSSATVALAAEALGTEECRIAKSLSFLISDRAIIVVAAGDARVDNKRFRAHFGEKPHMIPAEEVEGRIGHGVGGVCPFGVKDGVEVYLDESLRRFDLVYPAAGTSSSAVRLTLPELEVASESLGWVDVTKLPESEEK